MRPIAHCFGQQTRLADTWAVLGGLFDRFRPSLWTLASNLSRVSLEPQLRHPMLTQQTNHNQTTMTASGNGAPGAAAAQQGAGGTGAVDGGGDMSASSSCPGGQHYEEVAASYEAAFFYSSPDYRSWVMEHVLRHFGLPDEVGTPPDPRHLTGVGSAAAHSL